MDTNPFHTLAPAKRAAAEAAVRSTLGGSPATVSPISGGASGAFIFRIDSGGRRALLRVEGVPSPLRNPHQYISQRIASDVGISPRLLHLDEANGVSVMDFIAQQPLSTYPGGPPALMHALADLLHRLQGAPLFPHFVDYPDIVARLFAHVRRTGLFVDGLLDPHVERLAHLSEACAREPVMPVSSHNDSIAMNILFDGTRLWMIDWESAYRNDPLVDVAIMLDNLAAPQQLEDVLLRQYLGRELAALHERLARMRALTRLYYAGVLLSASATRPRSAPDADLTAPSLADFQHARATGTLASRAPQTIHVAGKMYLSSFLSGLPVPALDTL